MMGLNVYQLQWLNWIIGTVILCKILLHMFSSLDKVEAKIRAINETTNTPYSNPKYAPLIELSDTVSARHYVFLLTTLIILVLNSIYLQVSHATGTL